jgi:hypothetical protein
MVKLEFHDPSGVTDTTRAHAPRLKSLEGKRIGFISNDQWQSHRMLPMIREWLGQDFKNVELLPLDAFPQGTAFISTDETADLVKQSGVDAVIIGNAA